MCMCVPLMGTVLARYGVIKSTAILLVLIKSVVSLRGVLETLIQRHFPTPSSGINWNLFDSDPTLPENCRRSRKRGEEQ